MISNSHILFYVNKSFKYNLHLCLFYILLYTTRYHVGVQETAGVRMKKNRTMTTMVSEKEADLIDGYVEKASTAHAVMPSAYSSDTVSS